MRCSHKTVFRQCKNEALPIGVCEDHAHTCTKPDCSGLAASSLCPEHECASEGCIQPRGDHGDSCPKHGCEYIIQPDGVPVHCNNARVGKAKYCSEHICGEPGCRALHCIGPYCQVHGCKQRLEDGFCGDARKSNSYFCEEHACTHAECGQVRESRGEYCNRHTCATNGCRERRAENSKHCEAHECAHQTCHQERGVGKFCNRHGCIAPEERGFCGAQRTIGDAQRKYGNPLYCERHTCAQKSCLHARQGRGECCSDHGCVHREGGVACCAMREKGSDYCTNHSCAIADCGYPRDGKECCKRHGCQHTEPGRKGRCGIQKESGSDYCKGHACTRPRCGRHRGVGRMCGKHGCAFKADEESVVCGDTRKEGRRWCAEHACMQEKCKNSNNGVGRCCSEHGCVRKVSGGGRCCEPRAPGRELCAGHAYPYAYESSTTNGEDPQAPDPAPAVPRVRPGTSHEAMRLQLEKDLAESGLTCEVFGGNDSTWDDVVGLDDVKETVKAAIVYPLQEPDLPEGTWANGILLFGPPGTGKTMVAKATASEIDGFMVDTSSASLVSKWVGDSEKNVERLFRIVTKYADATGKPVVLFMDEVDALLGSYAQEGDWNVKTKSAFQTKMSDINAEKKKVYVIGTTNKPDRLEPPILRRFQKRVHVKLPSEEDRENLFRLHTRKFNVGSDVDFEALARLFVGYSASDIKHACDSAFNAMRAEARALSDGNPSGVVSSGRRNSISMNDFRIVHSRAKTPVAPNDPLWYEKWEEEHGSL